MVYVPFPDWFTPRHQSVPQELDEIKHLLGRLITMNETTDQALSDVTAIAQANSAALAKLKTDVAAALAAIQSNGTLNDAQQATADALKASLTADATTISEIDQSTQPVAPPATP
jgi:hypothetical protein